MRRSDSRRGRLAATALSALLATGACASSGPALGRYPPPAAYGLSFVCSRDFITNQREDWAGQLHLTVIDVTGESLPGTNVSLGKKNATVVTVVAAEDGRVRLRDLPTGRYSLRIWQAGFVAVELQFPIETGCITAMTVPLEVADVVD